MQQFVKFVRHFLIRNRALLLWFVREAPRYGIAALYAKHAAIFAKCTKLSRRKAPQSGKRRRSL